MHSRFVDRRVRNRAAEHRNRCAQNGSPARVNQIKFQIAVRISRRECVRAVLVATENSARVSCRRNFYAVIACRNPHYRAFGQSHSPRRNIKTNRAVQADLAAEKFCARAVINRKARRFFCVVRRQGNLGAVAADNDCRVFRSRKLYRVVADGNFRSAARNQANFVRRRIETYSAVEIDCRAVRIVAAAPDRNQKRAVVFAVVEINYSLFVHIHSQGRVVRRRNGKFVIVVGRSNRRAFRHENFAFASVESDSARKFQRAFVRLSRHNRSVLDIQSRIVHRRNHNHSGF